MSPALEVLARASGLGVMLSANGSRLRWKCHEAPPADLLADLARHKADLLPLLEGRVCVRCGASIPWRVDGLAMASGVSWHRQCWTEHRAEVAVDLRHASDEAEVTLRTEGEP